MGRVGEWGREWESEREGVSEREGRVSRGRVSEWERVSGGE